MRRAPLRSAALLGACLLLVTATAMAQEPKPIEIGDGVQQKAGAGPALQLYTFVALEGTQLFVTASTRNRSLLGIAVYGEHGERLAYGQDNVIVMSKNLPSDGVYVLSVARADSTAEFNFSLSVAPAHGYCIATTKTATGGFAHAYLTKSMFFPPAVLFEPGALDRVTARFSASLDSAGVASTSRSDRCSAYGHSYEAYTAAVEEEKSFKLFKTPVTQQPFRAQLTPLDRRKPLPLPSDSVHAFCSYYDGREASRAYAHAPVVSVPAHLAWEHTGEGTLAKRFAARVAATTQLPPPAKSGPPYVRCPVYPTREKAEERRKFWVDWYVSGGQAERFRGRVHAVPFSY